MSRELSNIIKILFVTFFLVFVWESAIAEEEEVVVLEEIAVTEEDVEKKTDESEEEPDCE